MCATLSFIRSPSESDVPFIMPSTWRLTMACGLLALMTDAESVETAEIRFDDEDVMLNKFLDYI
jgi:hypothetical protein